MNNKLFVITFLFIIIFLFLCKLNNLYSSVKTFNDIENRLSLIKISQIKDIKSVAIEDTIESDITYDNIDEKFGDYSEDIRENVKRLYKAKWLDYENADLHDENGNYTYFSELLYEADSELLKKMFRCDSAVLKGYAFLGYIQNGFDLPVRLVKTLLFSPLIINVRMKDYQSSIPISHWMFYELEKLIIAGEFEKELYRELNTYIEKGYDKSLKAKLIKRLIISGKLTSEDRIENYLRSQELDIVIKTVHALRVTRNKRYIKEIMKLTRNSNDELSLEVIQYFKMVGDPRYVRVLVRYLFSANDKIRISSLKTIIETGGERAKTILEMVIDKNDYKLNSIIFNKLKRQKNENYSDVWLKLIENEKFHKKSLIYLMKDNNKINIITLYRYFQKYISISMKNTYSLTKVVKYFYRNYKYLNKYNIDINPFVNSLQKAKNIRLTYNLIQLNEKLKSNKAILPLRNLVDNSNGRIRGRAILALGKLKDILSLGLFKKLLKEELNKQKADVPGYHPVKEIKVAIRLLQKHIRKAKPEVEDKMEDNYEEDDSGLNTDRVDELLGSESNKDEYDDDFFNNDDEKRKNKDKDNVGDSDKEETDDKVKDDEWDDDDDVQDDDWDDDDTEDESDEDKYIEEDFTDDIEDDDGFNDDDDDSKADDTMWTRYR